MEFAQSQHLFITLAWLNYYFSPLIPPQVIHRHETDQQLIDEVENSEVLLRHLNARNIAIEADMEVAKQVCVVER